MVLLQVRCINHSQAQLMFTSTTICKITSQEKQEAQVYTCVVCIILILGSLSKDVLSNPNQPEVDFLHSWAVVMAKFLSGKNKNT